MAAQVANRLDILFPCQLDALQRKGRALPWAIESADEHAEPKIVHIDAMLYKLSGHACRLLR
jgi:hypothetical protein